MAKMVLVLGGKSDIGLACAHEFAAAGYDITLAGRGLSEMVASTVDLRIRHGINAYAVEFDAARTESHQAVYAELPNRPDVVIYSIGSLGEQKESEKNWQEAEKVIFSNYVGAVSILSIAANDLEARNVGTIIGISSVAGDRGRASNYIYGSAKAGFTAFLAGLRHRLVAANVNVLTVKPGFVATKMTDGMDLPKPLTTDPKKIAKAVLNAYKNGKRMLYYLPIWRQLMFAVRSVPESIFVKTKL